MKLKFLEIISYIMIVLGILATIYGIGGLMMLKNSIGYTIP